MAARARILAGPPASGGSVGAYYASSQGFAAPGWGGSALQITITGGGALTVDGALSVDGSDSAAAGGGSGGSSDISVPTLAGSGVISAKGGAGGPTTGGGRVAVGFDNTSFTGQISAAGGNGAAVGGAGTVYLRTLHQVIVDNGGRAGDATPLATNYMLPPDCNLTVSGGARAIPLTELPSLRDLTIGNGGWLTAAPGSFSLPLVTHGNTTIAPGGLLSMDGRGYPQGLGAGAGASVASQGGGGGFGGAGGASQSGAAGGFAYGSPSQPADLGSPGGAGLNTGHGGSAGGGIVHLIVLGDLNVNGKLTAQGAGALQDNAGGGSGGSVWISANSLSGSGFIAADGGAGDFYGGRGGGGRVSIYAPAASWTGSVTAKGGPGFNDGHEGSIFLTADPAPIFISGVITNSHGDPVRMLKCSPREDSPAPLPMPAASIPSPSPSASPARFSPFCAAHGLSPERRATRPFSRTCPAKIIG